MDKKNNDRPSNESSLLFKFPNDLFPPFSISENILMPISVSDSSGNFNSSIENAKKEDAQNVSEPRTSSICQLEQPLLFRRVSSPDISDAVSASILGAQADIDTSMSRSVAQSYYESLDINEPVTPPSYPELAALYSDPAESSAGSELATPLQYRNSAQTPLPAYADNTGPLYTPTSVTLESNSTNSTGIFHQMSYSDYIKMYHPNTTNPDDINYLQSEEFTSQQCSASDNDNVKAHWMFQDNVESKEIWYGFSDWDSERLENAYQQGEEWTVIPTDGGRSDVYVKARIKKSVYFYSKELKVRRCTWFYKEESMTQYEPYDEETASYLEECYLEWIASNAQDKRFAVSDSDGNFIFEKPSVMLHYGLDSWTRSKGCPRIVRRGLPKGFQIVPNESPQIDNLLFIVQGIGSFCDLRFRTVSECVDGFRDIANKLIESHFKKDVDEGHIGRVEILPVAWHAKFRTTCIGLDSTMNRITLPSIPKLRHFTNDTLIDILLYSSPSYCQSILDTVAEELNTLYETFLSRNPGFSGKVFVAGHSLGSLIIFDILSNQNITECNVEKEVPDFEENSHIDVKKTVEEFSDITELFKSLNLEDYLDAFTTEKIDLWTLPYLTDVDLMSLGLPIGPRRKLMNAVLSKEKVSAKPNLCEFRKFSSCENLFPKLDKTPRHLIFPFHKSNTGIKPIIYPRLHFHPAGFFALGSPISMFLAIRGFDTISEKYSFPTCPAFYHIFHPYDPVAFRIEPMIDCDFKLKPALIPHHKGRKRMHLEIKDNVAKIASELRQKVMDTLHKTWNSFSEITGLQPFPSAAMETEVNSIVSQDIPEIATFDDNLSADVSIGNLNGGRRIDYVLQEKPLEALNDYVWALTSHATYWSSEDTVLMILREIYSTQGITVSPPNENDNLVPEDISTNDTCAKEHLPFSNEFFEKTLFLNLPANEKVPISTSAPLTSTVENSVSATTMPLSSEAAVFIPGAQHHDAPLTSTLENSVSAITMPSSSEASVCIPESHQTAPLTSTVENPLGATTTASPSKVYVSVSESQHHRTLLTSTVKNSIATTMPSSSAESGSELHYNFPLTSTVENPFSAPTVPSASGASVSIPGSQHHSAPLISKVKSAVRPCTRPSFSGASVSVPGSQRLCGPLTSTVKRTVSATSMPSSSGASVSIPGSQHIGPPPLSGFVKRSPFTK